MLHRRLLVDDHWGVGEALNETAFDKGLVARGKHYILFDFNLVRLPLVLPIVYQLGLSCTHSVFETEHSFFSPFVIESSHHCASRSLALILDIFSLKGHG